MATLSDQLQDEYDRVSRKGFRLKVTMEEFRSFLGDSGLKLEETDSGYPLVSNPGRPDDCQLPVGQFVRDLGDGLILGTPRTFRLMDERAAVEIMDVAMREMRFVRYMAGLGEADRARVIAELPE